MAAKLNLPRPTEAELELLRVIWDHGSATVREIHEAITAGEAKDTGYTTTLKILQKMTEKGLVARDESQRSHVYSAVLKREQTQRQLVKDLLQRAFGGAAGKLAVAALSEKRASPEELAEIRRLLEEQERSQS